MFWKSRASCPNDNPFNKSGAKHNDDLSQEEPKDSREESEKTSICKKNAGLSFYKPHISVTCPAKRPREHSRGFICLNTK